MRAANLLGGVAFEQGRLDDAEARFEETLRRAHVLNDAQMAARASNNLGSLVHLQGKGALAVNLYRSALPGLPDTGRIGSVSPRPVTISPWSIGLKVALPRRLRPTTRQSRPQSKRVIRRSSR